MTTKDKTTANTKTVLQELAAFEASLLPAIGEEINEGLANRGTMTPGERVALMEKAAKFDKLDARVKACLSQDDSPDSGTRNSAGAVVKAIRNFTGRNLLAEARALMVRDGVAVE